MLSKYDLRISDESAEAMFSNRAYEMAYDGEPLFYDEGEIYTYKNKYFDPEDAFDFLITQLGAETLPPSDYGNKTIDYMGRSIDVGEETYFYQGHAFYSDESLDFICFLGAKEVVL